jgi:tRNA(fMet)-specific endonuclease VapC
MYILDTNHLSVLERGGLNAQRLRQRLASVDPTQIAASIISYEEQMRGWLGYINDRRKTVEQQVDAYKQLRLQLEHYCGFPILDYDLRAAQEFERLKKIHRNRISTMDLKIAAIALINQAILLTQNRSDFENIAGLEIDDWI